MQNITLEDLDLVCGATTGAVTPTNSSNLTSGITGSSSACSGNDALMTSLNSIGSSIKDLSHKNNGGLFGGNKAKDDAKQQAAAAQNLDDDGVRVLEEFAGNRLDLRQETTIVTYRMKYR